MTSTSEQRRQESERIEVRIYQDRPATRQLFATLAGMVITFLAGATVPILASSARADLNTILISAATLCLGLGVASIVFQHRRAHEAQTMVAQCNALRTRADALLREYEAYAARPTR